MLWPIETKAYATTARRARLSWTWTQMTHWLAGKSLESLMQFTIMRMCGCSTLFSFMTNRSTNKLQPARKKECPSKYCKRGTTGLAWCGKLQNSEHSKLSCLTKLTRMILNSKTVSFFNGHPMYLHSNHSLS